MSTYETTRSVSQSFWLRNIWALLLAGLLALVGGLGFLQHMSQQQQLAEQRSQMQDLERQITEIEAVDESARNESLAEALGISSTRLDNDAQLINDLASLAFTWDTGVAYDEARESLKRRFSLTEEDVFLKEFMPPARFNEDSRGKRYYQLDAVGLNSEVSGNPEINVVSVVGTDYRYAALVETEMTADANNVTDEEGNELISESAERWVLLYVTVNGEGQITELSGVPASGLTRTSE